MNKSVFLFAVILIVSSMQAWAVSGKLVFEKKPPFAGALFAKSGSGSTNNTASLDQSNKVFNKKAFAVSNGGKIEFKNSDTFQHNIFANDAKSGVQFDVGLMEPNTMTNLDVSWEENTLTRIGCKIHPKMRSYILNTQSDYVHLFEFEKAVKEYDISIADVPADTTAFVLLLPKYDILEFELAPGESKSIDVMRKGKKKATLTVNR